MAGFGPLVAVTLSLLAALAAPPVLASATWRSCSPDSAPVVVKAVQVSPDPPVSGQNFTLLLPALTRQELDEGTVKVTVYHSIIPLPIHWQTEDLCEKVKCPVSPGEVTFHHVQGIARYAPAGTYSIWLQAEDKSHNELFCTEVFLKVVSLARARSPALHSPGDALGTRGCSYFSRDSASLALWTDMPVGGSSVKLWSRQRFLSRRSLC